MRGTRIPVLAASEPRASHATPARPRPDPRPPHRPRFARLPERPEGEVKSFADRLRELAERLPPGASVTLTRDGLLELAAVAGGRVEETVPQADFTVGELALRFHRSPSTIRDWCEHKRLGGAYKLNGRDWRIPQAAVDAFVARQRRQTQEPLVRLSAWRAVRTAK